MLLWSSKIIGYERQLNLNSLQYELKWTTMYKHRPKNKIIFFGIQEDIRYYLFNIFIEINLLFIRFNFLLSVEKVHGPF